MYTSLVISARLKRDTPTEVIDTIKALSKGEVHISSVVRGGNLNPIFGTSYYFPESSFNMIEPEMSCGELTINSVQNIKNYDGEIEKFIAWLKPWVDSGHGRREWWAIVTYEDGAPTIHYLYDE